MTPVGLRMMIGGHVLESVRQRAGRPVYRARCRCRWRSAWYGHPANARLAWQRHRDNAAGAG